MTTRSFWLLSGLSAFMVIAGLLTVNSTLIVLVSPLIIYMMVAVFFAPGEQKLQARRFLSTDRITQGMDVTVSIQVDNENARIDELHLFELSSFDSQNLEGDISKVAQLNPGESINYEYTFQAFWYVRNPGTSACQRECVSLPPSYQPESNSHPAVTHQRIFRSDPLSQKRHRLNKNA